MKNRTDLEKLKTLDLTELEKDFLTVTINGLYAEPGFSDQSVTDILQEAKAASMMISKSIAQAKGVLGSLVKKGILFTDDPHTDGQDIVYLHTDYYFLHAEWAAEQAALEDRDAEAGRLDPPSNYNRRDNEAVPAAPAPPAPTTSLMTLADQVEIVRDRLEELNYRFYNQNWSGNTLTRTYAERDTGLVILVVSRYDKDQDTVEDWHVYKEVSTSGTFAEYLAAID